ncbi:MAG: hypothetical protein A2Y12_10120 [Planctomycetes bacterium GWF2_42_9]|nr:MAG: hypothetical protein A2Y12_10120 [Planctomycetes bacterium GWF2_42_9]
MFTIKTVEVAAIIQGNYMQLIDRRGHNLRKIKCELLGMPDDLTVERMKWCQVMESQMHRLNCFSFSSKSNPWFKRANSMSQALRLRRKDRCSKGGRKQLDEWNTKTWKEAVSRVVEQAYNESRKYLQSPWMKWAVQISKNQQKRIESRYGKINNRIANS